MAKFSAELPTDLIKEFERMDIDSDDMFSDMVDAGLNCIYQNINASMNRAFKSTKSLRKGFVKTKPKRLKRSDGFGGFVGFDGYTDDGTPIPLIAMAREYGTSRGEAKRPFVRTSVHKGEIESAMLKVQNNYLPKE